MRLPASDGRGPHKGGGRILGRWSENKDHGGKQIPMENDRWRRCRPLHRKQILYPVPVHRPGLQAHEKAHGGHHPTVLGYKRTKKRMEDIIGVQLNDLTQEKIQRWVNQQAKDHSPKTVANAHGLLSAVLKEYRPSVTLRTTLPSKVKAEIQIPSEAEIRAILKGCRGTKYELPIMLAV